MAGKVTNGSPSGAQMDAGYGAADDQADKPESESGLSAGETAASPYEEHLLGKVMGAVFHSMNDPQKMRTFESWMIKAPPDKLGTTIGSIAFKLLLTVYQSAKSSGVDIPSDIFFGQGGAAQQTIDRLIMLAEHAGVRESDPDKIREDAMGVIADNVKQQFGDQMNQHNAPQQGQPTPQNGFGGAPPMAAANPMSHAVGQGLQSQGLMGGTQ